MTGEIRQGRSGLLREPAARLELLAARAAKITPLAQQGNRPEAAPAYVQRPRDMAGAIELAPAARREAAEVRGARGGDEQRLGHEKEGRSLLLASGPGQVAIGLHRITPISRSAANTCRSIESRAA